MRKVSFNCDATVLTPSPDLFWTALSVNNLYNTVFKIVFIGSSAYIVYLMLNDYRPTHDPNIDTFKVEYLIGGAAVLGILFPYKYTPAEVGHRAVTLIAR